MTRTFGPGPVPGKREAEMVYASPQDDEPQPVHDEELVQRCQDGDATAFPMLYRRHSDRLLRYCFRLLGDPAEAEDAVQEAFARAWKALPDFGGERRFYPWLSVIAHNLCVDLQRRGSHVTPLDDSVLSNLLPAEVGGQDLVAERATEHDLLVRALDDLPARHREVLELREGRNWTYQQIASHAGVEVSTIETLLYRARRSLKEKFLQLARAEGALGLLFGPLAALRQWWRRALAEARSSAAALRGALVETATPSGALGGAIGGAAAVATSAIVAASFAGAGANVQSAHTQRVPVHVVLAHSAARGDSGATASAAPTARTAQSDVSSRHPRKGSSPAVSTDPPTRQVVSDPVRSQPGRPTHRSPVTSPTPQATHPVRRVVQDVTGTVNTVVEQVKGTVGTVVRQVSGTVGTVVGTLGPTVGGLTSTVGPTVGGLTSTAGPTVGGLTSTAGSTVRDATGTAGSVMGGGTRTVGTTVGSVAGTVGTVVAGATHEAGPGAAALPAATQEASAGKHSPAPGLPVALPSSDVAPFSLP